MEVDGGGGGGLSGNGEWCLEADTNSTGLGAVQCIGSQEPRQSAFQARDPTPSLIGSGFAGRPWIGGVRRSRLLGKFCDFFCQNCTAVNSYVFHSAVEIVVLSEAYLQGTGHLQIVCGRVKRLAA